ncbi:MAG: TRAP transporter fused permease subunit [Gammaproteobacteria bacterium]|nr:TRAP transporter fused permease subunit [Gammaproteobacteria bacterium]
MLFGTAGILFHINQIFNLQFFVGQLLIDTAYFYILAGLFLSLVYIAYPAHKGAANKVPWYDWVLFAVTLGATFYLAWHGEQIIQEGWDLLAPAFPTVLAGVVCALSLEAVRRVGGWVLFFICGFFFAYPLFAESMPGFLWGPQSPFEEVVRLHAMGTESIIGVPMRVVASLLIGFLIFGSALVVTGGGEFFMAFATALMGKSRGGPAKVAILSSGFFGSLSGSVISNVVTTGQLTIPTMKRVGYPPTYSGAVEACASTGGALMPPVMGAVAFIMAEFLNVPYSTVVIAAIVPALLFYLALLLQADNYAARHGLEGQPEHEIPKLGPTLRRGWHFLLSLIVLVYLLVWVGIESHAPYYATALLLLTSAFQRDGFRFKGLLALIVDATQNIANIVGILVGIGMIVGSLSYTGVGGAFSRELLQYAGDNMVLLLFFGAITSFVLGMGMTVSACYIFLAIVMGPAMIDGGLDPVASHLFILYWGMLSYITPPVALAAVAASSIAGSSALYTGFMAMRMGIINFILPFLFVLTPTLILHGPVLDVVHDVFTACIAVWLMASAFEGWLYYAGRINWFARAPLLIGAVSFLYPGLASDLVGLALLVGVYVGCKLSRGSRAVSPSNA